MQEEEVTSKRERVIIAVGKEGFSLQVEFTVDGETMEFVCLFKYLGKCSSGGGGLKEAVNMRIVEGPKS